jgi:hypothetical protein
MTPMRIKLPVLMNKCSQVSIDIYEPKSNMASGISAFQGNQKIMDDLNPKEFLCVIFPG